jgi:predicted Zn-dependent protease
MNILFLIANALAYTKSDFHHIGYWESPPDIIICEDAKVDITIIKSSIEFWKKIGYNLNSDPKKKQCGNNIHTPGEIRITGQRNLDTVRYYAMTDRNYYEKNSNSFMLSANIKIGNDSDNNLELLIHELGHAIGIDHETHDKSHIMHHRVIELQTRYK